MDKVFYFAAIDDDRRFDKAKTILAWAQVPQRGKTPYFLNNRSVIHFKHDTVFHFKLIHSYLDNLENTPKDVHCLV